MSKSSALIALVLLVVLCIVWLVVVGQHLLLPNGHCLNPALYAPGC